MSSAPEMPNQNPNQTNSPSNLCRPPRALLRCWIGIAIPSPPPSFLPSLPHWLLVTVMCVRRSSRTGATRPLPPSGTRRRRACTHKLSPCLGETGGCKKGERRARWGGGTYSSSPVRCRMTEQSWTGFLPVHIMCNE